MQSASPEQSKMHNYTFAVHFMLVLGAHDERKMRWFLTSVYTLFPDKNKLDTKLLPITSRHSQKFCRKKSEYQDCYAFGELQLPLE